MGQHDTLENIKSNLKNVDIMDDCKTCHVYEMENQHGPGEIQIIHEMGKNPHKVQHVEDLIIGKEQ